MKASIFRDRALTVIASFKAVQCSPHSVPVPAAEWAAHEKAIQMLSEACDAAAWAAVRPEENEITILDSLTPGEAFAAMDRVLGALSSLPMGDRARVVKALSILFAGGS